MDLPAGVWTDDGAFTGLAPPFDECPPTLVVVSGPGEAVLVPSGWYHYVENIASKGIEDGHMSRMTVSLNHNWMNGFNIYCVWRFLLKELASVCSAMKEFLDDTETSTEATNKLDLMKRNEWNRHCNLTLKANSALSLSEFVELLASRVLYLYECARLQGCIDLETKGTTLAWAQPLCKSFHDAFEMNEYDVELFRKTNNTVLNWAQVNESNHSFSWTFSPNWSRSLHDSFAFVSDPEHYLNFCMGEAPKFLSVTRFGIRNISLILKELLGNSCLLSIWSDSVASDGSGDIDMRKSIADLFETSMFLYLNLQ
jgi:hypothetical protein